MRVVRRYTQAGQDLYAGISFRTVSLDGWTEYVVPQCWNRAAADILIEKVFYRGILPDAPRRIEEGSVPEFLWRAEADGAGSDRREGDIREVLNRMAGALTRQAWLSGVFSSEEDARAFHDEFIFIMLHRLAAPEIAQWAGLGLDWAYGIVREKSFMPRQRIASFEAGEKEDGAGFYISPQTPLAHVFRRIRILDETLALEGDEAKVSVLLPVENGDSAAFIEWRRRQEIDAVARAIGLKTLRTGLHHVMDSCVRGAVFGFDPGHNPKLAAAVEEAEAAGLPFAAADIAVSYARQGYEEISIGAERGMEEESRVLACLSVPDELVENALTGHGFMQYEAGKPVCHASAQKIWNDLAENIWAAGAPSVFFRDSATSSSFLSRGLGRSFSGGFVFLPECAAPAAVINLPAFADEGRLADTEALGHVAAILLIAAEAAADFAGTAANEYRPVQIGMTGFASLLMAAAIPYDSDAGRATAALLTAFVSGAAHRASAQIAADIGAFPVYAAHEKTFLQAVRDKTAALAGGSMRRGSLKKESCPDAALSTAAARVWEEAYALGCGRGFRHAFLTAVDTDSDTQALLGAQTRDIAPESSLARFEGYFSDTLETAEIYGKKLNPAVPCALKKLGYSSAAIDDIYFYAVGHGTLFDAPHVNHGSLRSKGFPQAVLDALEAALKSAQHIRYIFNKWTLGADFCRSVLGFSDEQLDDGMFDMLAALGYSGDEIEAASLHCCGTAGIEGAAHLKPEHLAVFDCIILTGEGMRSVSPEAQIRMQAAIEPFLSGAAVHTVLLSHEADIGDVQKLLLLGWELGVGHVGLYREGCSLTAPYVRAVRKTAPLTAQNENDVTDKEEEDTCRRKSTAAFSS